MLRHHWDLDEMFLRRLTLRHLWDIQDSPCGGTPLARVAAYLPAWQYQVYPPAMVTTQTRSKLELFVPQEYLISELCLQGAAARCARHIFLSFSPSSFLPSPAACGGVFSSSPPMNNFPPSGDLQQQGIPRPNVLDMLFAAAATTASGCWPCTLHSLAPCCLPVRFPA